MEFYKTPSAEEKNVCHHSCRNQKQNNNKNTMPELAKFLALFW